MVYVGAFLVGGLRRRRRRRSLFISNTFHDSGCFDTSSQKFLLLRYEDQSDRGTNMNWVALNVVRRYFIIELGLQSGHWRPSFIKYLFSVPVPFKNKSKAGRIEFPIKFLYLSCTVT